MSGDGEATDGQTGGGTRRWRAGTRASGRLDSYLAVKLGLSRSRISGLVAEGFVRVDGKQPKKSDAVASGQVMEVVIPPPAPIEAAPQDIPVDIVFQDEHLVVVNKQPGLVVHPAPGHADGTLVNALLYHVGDLSGIGGALRPGIVHRLDKDTSGLMVVAKTDLAHQELSSALKFRRVRRTYLAAIWGTLPNSPATVDKPIGRHPRDRVRMAVVAEGRPARTRFRHLENWPAASMCEVGLETGRTHQIRVHAAALGHAVVGDALYGAGFERRFSGWNARWARELAKAARRQFLHADRLEFEHPVTAAPVSFRARLPPDLAAIRDWARSTASGSWP